MTREEALSKLGLEAAKKYRHDLIERITQELHDTQQRLRDEEYGWLMYTWYEVHAGRMTPQEGAAYNKLAMDDYKEKSVKALDEWSAAL